MSRMQLLRAVYGVTVMAAATTLSLPVGASAVTAIDTFTIVRSGITGSQLGTYEGQQVFYRDGFGDGAEPPSGGSFFNGQAGIYVVLGNYPNGAESGGKLTLNSARGGPFINADGNGRTLQRSVLPTDVNPLTENGLKENFHSFAAFGLFDLTIPPLIGDGYGIVFNDGGPAGATTSLDLLLRRDENGNVYIRFQEQDFKSGKIDTIERDLLAAPQDADQIEFRLQRADIATNIVTGAYRFWDNGAPMTTDFVEMSNSVEFFRNNGWARGGFFAVQAYVPEPGSLALVLAAGAGVVATRRRRRA